MTQAGAALLWGREEGEIMSESAQTQMTAWTWFRSGHIHMVQD